MINDRLYKILLAPHVSEKSSISAESQERYVFKVVPDATKLEVKKSVEALFNVKVDSVNILNQNGKKKVYKGRIGTRKSTKKAIVRLAPGQDLDFVSGE